MNVHRLLLGAAFCASLSANAQVMQRELGDFDLRFATAPTRSMAQGLVKPGGGDSLHGGLDISHESGWYLGGWAANLEPDKPTEVDSYAGFKQPLGRDGLGYELGSIRYVHPERPDLDTQDLYGGLSIFGSRLGAAYSNSAGRSSATLFADLGLTPPLGFDLTLKYASYSLANPVGVAGGGNVSGFNDWSVNVSRPWLGIDLNLSYSGSSLSGTDCSAYSGHNTYCDGAVTFKASRPFF
ncbi:TorF family putative porin [Pseudomonas citronellolis]|uniref:TorF family putative porin n=1 Tax=Pseudomonas citronellolis TaxID=53408 RepID=UPI0023E36911|nr:TorF family putative porin [Pseudomonas citronellolis]MDF3931422.1 TorF family putative porin [Pseudomonas citronellolis]